MTVNTSPDALVSVGAGLIVAALGLWVLRVAPRRRLNRAVAAFGVGLGSWTGILALFFRQPDALAGVAYAAGGVLATAGGVGLWVVALAYPAPLRGASRRGLAWPVAAAGVYAAVGFAGAALEFGDYVEAFLIAPEIQPAFMFFIPASVFLFSGFLAVILAMGLRWRAETDLHRRDRRLFGWLAGGMAVYAGFFYGSRVVTTGPVGPVTGWVFLVMLVVAAALWLSNVRGPDARLARNVAWTCLGAPLVGLAVSAAAAGGTPATASGGGSQFLVTIGIRAASMLVAAAVLGYAVVRYQLFDIDVKIRWTVKQSTVAAAFVAVFFVVSEGAALLFSGRVGPWVGIVAAGLLVFALAPLQRVAERVASAAMPGVKPVGELTLDERLAFYAEHLRVAYADGVVDAGERALLLHARERLGIGSEDAERVEREVLRARGVRA
ncbi:MAG: hypothetical protein ACT4PT_06800 [Methanobacteriota archaeon]